MQDHLNTLMGGFAYVTRIKLRNIINIYMLSLISSLSHYKKIIKRTNMTLNSDFFDMIALE